MANNIKVTEDILVYALRYAIGRRSYSPIIVFDNIRQNINTLSTYTIKQMYDEIVYTERQQDFYAPQGTNLFGDEINQKIWIELRHFLEDTLNKNGALND